MAQFIEDLQVKLKNSSSNLALVLLKVFIGGVLGLVFSLVGQQIAGYGDFAFFLVIIVTLMAFYRISRPWNFVPVLVFSLICVLIGLLLRMYILIAPGA
jgi:hypothetical protein